MKQALTVAKAARLGRKAADTLEAVLDEYNNYNPENPQGLPRVQTSAAVGAAKAALELSEKALKAHAEERPQITAEMLEQLSDAELEALANGEGVPS